MIKLIRLYYKTVSKMAPTLAANSAFELFQIVREKKIREREKDFYRKAKHFQIPFENEDLDCYEFGDESSDLILMAHGWESNAGCLHAVIERLLEQKKRIITFNLPAHAFYKTIKTNFFICKKAVTAVIQRLPEHKSLSLISHSFGSAVSSYALSEIDIKMDKMIFLTSLDIIEDVFIEFKNFIQLGDEAYTKLVNRASLVLGESLEEISIAEKLRNVNYKELHIIHDKSDKVIPYKNALQIKEKNKDAIIHTFDKIGHYRMLWNEEVLELVSSIVKGTK